MSNCWSRFFLISEATLSIIQPIEAAPADQGEFTKITKQSIKVVLKRDSRALGLPAGVLSHVGLGDTLKRKRISFPFNYNTLGPSCFTLQIHL